MLHLQTALYVEFRVGSSCRIALSVGNGTVCRIKSHGNSKKAHVKASTIMQSSQHYEVLGTIHKYRNHQGAIRDYKQHLAMPIRPLLYMYPLILIWRNMWDQTYSFP
ncbi:hypothetical protein ANAPC5_00785 [Anaplasma phagocytophilum]|nr:hypothetical protein ANAPC5_00785 [Anaplasma phagocytophilum]